MWVLRKRKPYNEDDPPIPDIVYQMAAEQAARFVALNPQTPYNTYNINGQVALDNMAYAPITENANNEISQGGTGRPSRVSSAFNRVRSVFSRGRVATREQYPNESRQRFNRAGSPDHFRQRPLGSPLNFRSRQGSPQLVNSRPGSPRLFGSRPGSPYQYANTEQTPPLTYQYVQEDRASSPQRSIPVRPLTPAYVQRKLALAQLSQDLQQAERQQRLQQTTLMSSYSTSFMPQYQQPYYSLMNSNVATQGYPTTMQPQMYTFY